LLPIPSASRLLFPPGYWGLGSNGTANSVKQFFAVPTELPIRPDVPIKVWLVTPSSRQRSPTWVSTADIAKLSSGETCDTYETQWGKSLTEFTVPLLPRPREGVAAVAIDEVGHRLCTAGISYSGPAGLGSPNGIAAF
jgi:hypothetical protein